MECFKYFNQEEKDLVDSVMVLAAMLGYEVREAVNKDGFHIESIEKGFSLYVYEKKLKLRIKTPEIIRKGSPWKQQQSRKPVTRIPLIKKIRDNL